MNNADLSQLSLGMQAAALRGLMQRMDQIEARLANLEQQTRGTSLPPETLGEMRLLVAHLKALLSKSSPVP